MIVIIIDQLFKIGRVAYFCEPSADCTVEMQLTVDDDNGDDVECVVPEYMNKYQDSSKY